MWFHELDAMRRGFTSVDIGEILGNLTATDLRMMLCGPECITSNMVLDAIDFDYGDWVPPKVTSTASGDGSASGRWSWIGLMRGGGDNPATKGLKVLNNLKRYIESMDEPKLRKFLRFATGSSSLSATFMEETRASDHVPVNEGVSGKVDTDNDAPRKIRLQRLPRSERLPEAHTCFNLVELPAYASYETLREKFDLAIGGVEAAIGRE